MMARKIAFISKGLTEKTMAGLLRLIDALHRRGASHLSQYHGNTDGKQFATDTRVISLRICR